MAVKSPLTARTPAVLPIVTNAVGSESVVVIDADKQKVAIQIRPRREKAAAFSRKRFRFLEKIPFDIVLSVLIWYYVGVGSICTTKVLLSQYSVPPLVLTLQQLVLGSSLLRLHLWATGGLQSLPKQEEQQRSRQQLSIYHNLILMGIFNALDFVATNTSFSLSSASFVETIKASEPITTTAIALFYGIEVLSLKEAFSILILVAGVFVSTLGNATQSDDGSSFDSPEEAELRWHRSIKTCVIILSANVCFAFRIKSQKVLRAQPEGRRISDASLLMWMQQAGAVCLLFPVMLFELPGIVQRTRETPWEVQKAFWCLSIANAMAFATYLLAQFNVLSKLSVAAFTGLGCLRRMNAIVCTAVAFGVAITPVSAFGIFLSIYGFCSFSYHRHSNPPGSNGRPAPPSTLSPILKAPGMTSRV